jgi:hypothetical protein
MEDGFYWVRGAAWRPDAPPVVAEFEEGYGWALPGDHRIYRESDLAVIGDRLQPPAN